MGWGVGWVGVGWWGLVGGRRGGGCAKHTCRGCCLTLMPACLHHLHPHLQNYQTATNLHLAPHPLNPLPNCYQPSPLLLPGLAWPGAGCVQGHDDPVRRRLHLPRGAGDQPQGGHRARQVPQHSHPGVRACLPARPPARLPACLAHPAVLCWWWAVCSRSGDARCICLWLRALPNCLHRSWLHVPAPRSPRCCPALPCLAHPPLPACLFSNHSERKNVNLPGVIVDLPTLTEKDVDDLVNWVGGGRGWGQYSGGSTTVAVQQWQRRSGLAARQC